MASSLGLRLCVNILNCKSLWHFWTANEIIDKAICCTATHLHFQPITLGKSSPEGSAKDMEFEQKEGGSGCCVDALPKI